MKKLSAKDLLNVKLLTVSYTQTTIDDAVELLQQEFQKRTGNRLPVTTYLTEQKRKLRISETFQEAPLLDILQKIAQLSDCSILIRDMGLVVLDHELPQPLETFRKVKPNDVFTPRLADVNREMYVARPRAEQALRNALRGTLHMIIHGESGTGKSWLYKKTFRDEGIPFRVANLANASRLGSIAEELKNLVHRAQQVVKTGYEEEKSAGVNAALAKGEIKHTGQYKIGQLEPFEACLRYLHGLAEGETSLLVFDNLEAAFTEPLLKELADLIILCDDERYASYKVKILIVGVPSGVKEYFYNTPHLTTVANRITELPEVTRLEKGECESLIKRGIIEKLQYDVSNLPALLYHVAWLTDRVPQVVHEYCLELTMLCSDLGLVTTSEMQDADHEWMMKSLYYAYGVVESHMNERDTKTGRRNQALYSLALCEGEQFRAQEVEDLVRAEFPLSTEGTILNIPQILSQLSAGQKPLIRRSPKGDAFFFKDPRHRMVLRAMLIKTTDGRVEKRPISRGQSGD